MAQRPALARRSRSVYFRTGICSQMPPQEEPLCGFPARERTLPQRSRVLWIVCTRHLGPGALLKVPCSPARASWLPWPLLWSVFRQKWEFQVLSPSLVRVTTSGLVVEWPKPVALVRGGGPGSWRGHCQRMPLGAGRWEPGGWRSTPGPAVHCPDPETRPVLRREPRPLLR